MSGSIYYPRDNGGWKRDNGGWLIAPHNPGCLSTDPGPLPGWRLTFPPSEAPKATLPYPDFPETSWDPAYLGSVIVGQFSKLVGWEALIAVAKSAVDLADPKVWQADFDVLYAYTQATYSPEERVERLAEIQDQAFGFPQYFCKILGCSPETKRNTYMLLVIANQIGSLVASTLKYSFKRPRPEQVWPELTTLIATPRHPAFPSGHALEAYLAARITSLVLPAKSYKVPNLNRLADRIAINREVALVHYPSDKIASYALVQPIYEILEAKMPYFDMILNAAITENK